MTTDYAERIDQAMHDAYGVFTPGSIARAIREDNYRLGLRTCGYCLRAYRSRTVVSDGRRQRLGRGHYYCSWRCYRADRCEQARWRAVAELHDDGTLVLDLRRCRECAA